VRVVGYLPLPILYALCAALAWTLRAVFAFRLDVVRENLAQCFPSLSPREFRRLIAAHYRNMGEIVAEALKGASMAATELTERVTLRNVELPRSLLARGRPILLVAAHLGNWEWVLHALALQLGYPVDVAYKPIRSAWLERAMFAIRSRFGAHMVAARDQLVAEVLRRRHVVRGIAMLADQSPVSSDHMHWTHFLGRDTAFYVGAEKLAQATRYDALFVALRRQRRGYYEIEFQPLAEARERLAPGVFTERYAQRVETEIRAAPADWTWGHRRWKPRREFYGSTRTQ
jgi:KDO2-lipid IV(A) lauroyltransferase